MGDGRSFGQLTMQIVERLMGGGPIVGFDSFIDHKDDEEQQLEVSANSDSEEGFDGAAAPITDSQPSITQPAMI